MWTTTVTDALRRHNIEILPAGEWKRRQRAPELGDPRWLADNYKTRLVTDIATELNVTVSTVYAALRRNGVTVRDSATSRRMQRPAELSDSNWLRDRYESASGIKIAEELGCNTPAVYSALREHGIEVRDGSRSQQLPNPPELDDAAWLRKHFTEVSGPDIAKELPVTPKTLYKALERCGIAVTQSPWVNHGHPRHAAPDEKVLRRLWESEGNIKGVTRHLDFAANTQRDYHQIGDRATRFRIQVRKRTLHTGAGETCTNPAAVGDATVTFITTDDTSS